MERDKLVQAERRNKAYRFTCVHGAPVNCVARVLRVATSMSGRWSHLIVGGRH